MFESIPKMVWLIPSFHGDIKLEKKGKSQTALRAFQLTGTEEKAMESLRSRAVSTTRLRKSWASEADFLPLTNAAYRGDKGVTVILNAPIEDVAKFLAKALKPSRKLLTAVKFADGRVEEIHSNMPKKAEEEEAPPVSEKKAKADAPKEPTTAIAATVARPVNGCPMPAFPEADIRASRVLETFLTPDQIADYRSAGCFISVGADSGHRYLIGNRERPSLLQSKLGGRQLFDLEEQHAICVHDWTVPPPEEMLALHLCISLPGHEQELLSLPEIDEELALSAVDPRYRPVIGRG
jgi:hypothetical protein